MADLGNMTVTVSGDVNPLKKSMDQAAATMQSAGKKIQVGANQAGNALSNLSRVAQDAPFGFIGIQNNLNPLLESFQRLKAETGSTKVALKALAGSLMGAGGLGLALSLASSAMLFFGNSSGGAGEKLKGLAGVMAEVKGEFIEAASNVGMLRQEITLAKDGFLNKDQVVKHYNETIGKTTGLVNDIEEAERALQKNANAYIQMTFFKAVATQALSKAAEEYLKIQRLVNTEPEKKKGFMMSATADAMEKAAADKKAKDINEAFKETVDLMKIAEEANKKAATIAKDFKFNWFGDTKALKKEKEKKVKEIKEQLQKIATEIETEKAKLATPKGSDKLTKGGFLNINQEQINKEMQEAFNTLDARLMKTYGIISSLLSPAFDALFNSIGQGGKDAFAEFGKALMQTIKQLAIAVAKALIFYGIISLINPGLLLGADGKKMGAGGFIKKFLGFANGGQNLRGGLAVVGERGPELMNIPRGADIVPNRALRMGGGGGSQQIEMVGQLKASGSDLILVMDRATLRKGRNG